MWLCRPDEPQPRRAEHPAHGLRGGAAGEREAELLVLVRGGDVLVGVRLDADRHPHQHVLHAAVVAGDPVQPGDLVVRVQHDRADAGRDSRGELGGRLVVAVQRDPLGREVRTQRDRQLAAAAHVQRQPLLGDPAGHLNGQERLGRVVHERRVAERGGVLGAAGAEVGLVHHEQRRAVLLRERRARPRPARRTTPSSPRPALRGHTAASSSSSSSAVDGRGPAVLPGGRTSACRGPAGCARIAYIRSGARTPSRPRPLARTWRTAAHRTRRAVVSGVASSSPCGRIRQLS